MASRSLRRTLLGLSLASSLCAFLPARPAFAEPTSDERAMAEALFEDGRRLMAEGKFPDACVKLEESQRLDPGGGTLLNVALCHESLGKTATAWAEFREALALARKDGREDRQRFAEEHLALLEPRLARIVVSVAQGAEIVGLEVKRDGAPVARAAWGTPIPADPGVHVITATAPGRAPFQATVTLDAAGGRTEAIEVPLLAPATTSDAPAAPEGTSTQRLAGYVVGGVGLVAVGVGSYFGLRAISREQDANDRCSESTCPDRDALSASEDANDFATLANVGVGGGLALLGVGALLVWTAPSADSATSARLAPTLGPEGGGLTVAGRF
jgi:tetratricopeptide (TPR) repeat protein